MESYQKQDMTAKMIFEPLSRISTRITLVLPSPEIYPYSDIEIIFNLDLFSGFMFPSDQQVISNAIHISCVHPT